MRIGVTYLYSIFKFGYPPKAQDDFTALKQIRGFGFRFVEMEGLGRKHFAGIWRNRADYRLCLDDLGMHVHNFCGVDPELVSLDRAKRRRAYDHFKRIDELGEYLGVDTLHLASYAPPVRYVGRSPYALGEDYAWRDKFRIRIPGNFSWQRVWDTLVESCRTCASIAGKRTVIIEPRVGEIICSPDSMLRLIADVAMKNFKANFDTAHFSAQRESVPLALMKLEGKFANIHIADNDPVNSNHLPIGRGVIDWEEFFRILKRMNYNGYLGLDFGGRTTIEKDYRSSVTYLARLAKRLGIALEW